MNRALTSLSYELTLAYALALLVLSPTEVYAQSTISIHTVDGKVPAESAAVNLGLPSGTIWAPYNIGATKPNEIGAYFAWGETTAKENYDSTTYKNTADDAAVRNWGQVADAD